jgi:hypothetical protein
MIKVRIREEYKDKKIYVAGTLYDFSNKTDEQLSLVWEQNPEFRIFLEETISIQANDKEVLLNEQAFKDTVKSISKKRSRK